MTTTEKDPHAFLLVSDRPKAPWAMTLQQTLSALGKLEIVPEEKAMEATVQSRHDVVMVDAGAVQDAALLVSCLRANRTDLRVVVFTSSPTWQRAREALQAGAADYLRKSLDEKEIRSSIESVLELPPPGVK